MSALAPMYRMPTVFGPAPGPRNLPKAHRHRRYEKTVMTLTLSAATDDAQLSRMLPPELELDGEPRIELSLIALENIGWLAGRGYNIIMVRIPARHRSDPAHWGVFVPIVWENMADPILTGREELGWPKLFADISYSNGTSGSVNAEASWDGFCFLEVTAEGLAEDSTTSAPSPLTMMFEKYLPATGQWGAADVRYLTALGPEGPTAELTSVASGTGHFTFHSARWEDMPTQYPIVNALAGLELRDFNPARLTRSSGGGDASGQRKVVA